MIPQEHEDFTRQLVERLRVDAEVGVAPRVDWPVAAARAVRRVIEA